jgi:hypothetical protein
MNLVKLLALLWLSAVVGCEPATERGPRYQINLPSEVVRAARHYAKTRTEETGEFLTVSWVAFFNGDAIFVSSSRVRPDRFAAYPVAWSYVDRSLVCVYDSRFANYVTDSVALMKEVNHEMTQSHVREANDLRNATLVEDNLSLRFIQVDGVQTIDTSYLNVRICQQLGRRATR